MGSDELSLNEIFLKILCFIEKMLKNTDSISKKQVFSDVA